MAITRDSIWNTHLHCGETLINPDGCRVTKKTGRNITVTGELSQVHIVDRRGRVVRWPAGQRGLNLAGSSQP